ncbi:hypothetical protein IJ21_14880 [Paenibacillus sp. 32O-W]|jgi:hypothetical protein|uniref:Sporulation membrane protein YtrI C-terminal domain-containing protein n=1 Tax=Paenibacillus cisolokensis TaxID=1658519 RepID=A0ABQ4NDM6_9BACL|nr:MULTISPECIES: hypothetical protein [Paenibacillus]ALS26892.1 hypothetical protein IJ21_14880 [Paenibacillus sp. 32O-W]GIQ66034.1 hypothetical protein PACILC2_46020 [Paenibacillus cisolokensis]
MRVPPFERYTKGLQAAGLLLLGIVIGAALFSAVYHSQFNALVEMKSDLEQKLDQYEEDIRYLNLFKNQHTVIKSVLPRLEEEVLEKDEQAMDEMTKGKLKSRIKEDLGVLIGKSIYEIDSNAHIARRLLSRKVYNVNGKEFTVEIKTVLVVDNVLQVWFKADVYDRPPA